VSPCANTVSASVSNAEVYFKLWKMWTDFNVANTYCPWTPILSFADADTPSLPAQSNCCMKSSTVWHTSKHVAWNRRVTQMTSLTLSHCRRAQLINWSTPDAPELENGPVPCSPRVPLPFLQREATACITISRVTWTSKLRDELLHRRPVRRHGPTMHPSWTPTLRISREDRREARLLTNREVDLLGRRTPSAASRRNLSSAAALPASSRRGVRPRRGRSQPLQPPRRRRRRRCGHCWWWRYGRPSASLQLGTAGGNQPFAGPPEDATPEPTKLFRREQGALQHAASTPPRLPGGRPPPRLGARARRTAATWTPEEMTPPTMSREVHVWAPAMPWNLDKRQAGRTIRCPAWQALGLTPPTLAIPVDAGGVDRRQFGLADVSRRTVIRRDIRVTDTVDE